MSDPSLKCALSEYVMQVLAATKGGDICPFPSYVYVLHGNTTEHKEKKKKNACTSVNLDNAQM